MPPATPAVRFYFDVREGDRFFPDDEGITCAGLAQVEREAVAAAAGIARDRLPAGNVREVAVEVRDERGQRVLAVTINLAVNRS